MSDQDIATIRDKTTPIFIKNGISYAALFGSHARGEARSDSDVDILVRFDDTPSLLVVIGIEQKLAAAVGKKVDLVTEGALSPYIRDAVIASAIPLYVK